MFCSSIAMAVMLLPGVVASSSPCSVSQCSSAPKSYPSVPISVPVQPPGVVASLLGSTVSLIASVPPSLALNYNEFVNRSENAKPAAAAAASGIDFDLLSSNPVALLAGVAAVAVPLIAFRAYATPQSFGSVSAVAAFAALSNTEPKAQLLDIRAPEDVKATGTVSLKSLRKKALQVAYYSDDKAFVDTVFAKCRDAENTTLYVLDQLDGNSLAVAKLLANSGFEKAFAIKGGVEGPNGWQVAQILSPSLALLPFPIAKFRFLDLT